MNHMPEPANARPSTMMPRPCRFSSTCFLPLLPSLLLCWQTSFADATSVEAYRYDALLAQTQSADQLFEPRATGAVPASDAAEGGARDSLFMPGTEERTADTAGHGASLSGFFQNELAYTYPSPDHYSKFRNTLELVADGTFAGGASWRLGGRFVYDPIFDATNFYPDRVRDDQTLEAQIREAFIDFRSGSFDFRVGRQHIIWGEVLGGFVADVVSAKDLRESVVQDFDLLRIPQWAVMVEHYRGDLYAQLLWIPLMTVNDIGKPGAEFFPFAMNVPPGFVTAFRDDDGLSPALSNSGLGARVSYLLAGWDTSLFYFTSMDQNAAFRREVLGGATPTLLFTPVHERIHQVGATVTKDLDPALVKLETAYTVDRLYENTSFSDADGLVRQDALDYLIGVEWAFANETTLNVQFTQRWFTDHVPTIVPDEVESGFSVYLSTKAFHPDVKPELLWIQSLNRSDWLIEAKVTWEFEPDWQLVLGADIFGGPSTGLFGRFDDKDRVYYELRHAF